MLASRQACANPVVTQFGLRGYCVLRSLIESTFGGEMDYSKLIKLYSDALQLLLRQLSA